MIILDSNDPPLGDRVISACNLIGFSRGDIDYSKATGNIERNKTKVKNVGDIGPTWERAQITLCVQSAACQSV